MKSKVIREIEYDEATGECGKDCEGCRDTDGDATWSGRERNSSTWVRGPECIAAEMEAKGEKQARRESASTPNFIVYDEKAQQPEDRRCVTCKHGRLVWRESPCDRCRGYERWEPKQPEEQAEQERCGNCRYWEERTVDHDFAECRRFPPHGHLGFGKSHRKTGWCGEWKERSVKNLDIHGGL